MSRYLRLAACAAIGAILSTATAVAADRPDGTITFSGGGVAFIAGWIALAIAALRGR